MRGPKEDLPITFQEGAAFSRDAEWGDMNVSFEFLPAGLDIAPLFKGLPDDRCQCPHWGYVFKGRFRVRYRDHEEIVRGGDLYYMAPGHVPFIEEDTELVEFSPKAELRKTMEVVGRNMAAMAKSG